MDRSGQTLTRIVFPLVLFLALIAGLAWSLQYIPKPHKPVFTPTTVTPPDTSSNAELVKFAFDKAYWDPNDKDYIKQFEKGEDGHTDFPFDSTADTDLEMRLHEVSCGCLRVDIALGDKDADPDQLTWYNLEPGNKDKKIAVPPRAHGFVRVKWKDQSGPGARHPFRVKIWAQPKGSSSDRQIVPLDAIILIAAPLVFIPDKEKFDVGNVEKHTFEAWSVTRDNFDLAVQEACLHPNIDVDIMPMDSEQLAKLREKLSKSMGKPRPKAGFIINVTVHNEKNGHLLDEGVLSHTLGLEMRPHGKDAAPFPLRTAEDQPIGPLLQIYFRGDVKVFNSDDPGHANLGSFAVNLEAKRHFKLQSTGASELKIDKIIPVTISASLKKSPESNAALSLWDLEVVIPANSQFAGPLKEDAAIVLQNSESRKVRIRLVGNGVNPR